MLGLSQKTVRRSLEENFQNSLLVSENSPHFRNLLGKILPVWGRGQILQDHVNTECRRWKLHLIVELVPGRPVCSCSSSLIDNISVIDDCFVMPLLFTIPSHIKDTN